MSTYVEVLIYRMNTHEAFDLASDLKMSRIQGEATCDEEKKLYCNVLTYTIFIIK